jgi:hypothetical protein
MSATHASLRDLYECSAPELDVIAEAGAEAPGGLGARLTGAGFGGCAVLLVAAGREAEAMVSTMQGLIAQIDQSSTETTKTITNRAYTLDAAVSGVLDRSAEAFASIGETLGAQARSVEQMVATARTDLDGFGAEWTRVIGQHLDVLLGAASQLKGQFSEQLQMSDQLRSSAAASSAPPVSASPAPRRPSSNSSSISAAATGRRCGPSGASPATPPSSPRRASAPGTSISADASFCTTTATAPTPPRARSSSS